MMLQILLCIVILNCGLLSTGNSLSQTQHGVSKNVHKYENFEEFDEMKNVVEYFNSHLFGTLLPINLTSEDITLKCQFHHAEYLRQLENFTFWAIKMYDSSAKMPSGILNGNINQFGDFDECINTRSDNNEISGQYCLSNFQISVPKSEYLSKLYKLLFSHFMFQSTLNDPGHIVKRFSLIHWALCVPSSCTYKDVEIGLKAGLQTLIDTTGISIQVKVNAEMCQTADNSIPLSIIFGGLFFIAVIGFTLIVTIIDYIFEYPLTDLNGIQGILFAFSLRRTLKSLFSLKRTEDDITSVHGIRFLHTAMLLITHKGLSILFIPYTNTTHMTEVLGNSWTVVVRTASLYTDTFLMISGMLTIYSYFGQLNRGKSINIITEYSSRLLRIVPPLAALILFSALIQSQLGSGPLWNEIVKRNSDTCKNYWWRNILFIQNYFGFENMCAFNTHHIATDTQLFFTSPLIFWILWKWKNRGSIILIIFAVLSTVLRYYITYTMHLSSYVYFGVPIKQILDSANYMYTLPTHRATVYIIGALLGYYLQTMKNIKLNPVILNIGNITAITMFSIALMGPAFMSDISYKFNPVHGASYAAFAPILWCLSFAWIIFTKHLRYSNALNRFLSWRGFLVSTRLSYAVYLIQISVFYHLSGTARNSDYFNLFKTLPGVGEIIFILFVSIIWTLLFDTPFQIIRRKYVNKSDTNVIEVKKNSQRDEFSKKIK